MKTLFSVVGSRSPRLDLPGRPRSWRALLGIALTSALLAGVWAAASPPGQALAVGNEENTKSYSDRDPAGAGNEPSTWFAYARAGETLTVEAGSHEPGGASWVVHAERAFYTITGPDGALVQTNEANGGFPEGTPDRELGSSMLEPETQPDAIVVPEGGDGIYRIALRSPQRNWNTSSYPWQITVTDAGGAEVPGRVWVETYRMVEKWPSSLGISQAELNGLDLDYWFVSEQGYEYELRLNGFVGWNSVIEASLLGNTDENCVSQYHSLIDQAAIKIECDDKYNTFFEKPAADLPAGASVAAEHAGVNTPQVPVAQMWIAPPIEEPAVSLVGFVGSGNGDVPKAGTLNYALSNFAGNYSILLDADGDGSFDGPLDRKIPQSLTRATGQASDAGVPLSFAFDGLDAAGNAIPANVPAQLTILIEHFPELHFVFGDVEQLAGGLSLTRTNGGGDPGADLVYWNDSLPPASPVEEPSLLGTEACGPADALPGADNARNPIVNTDGMANVEGLPALRFWGTDLGSPSATQGCRDNDSPVTGSYGNEKLLDTWSYADVSIVADARVIGPALVVAKRADAETAVARAPLGYTLTASNTGSVDLTAAAGSPAVVKDNLGGPASAAAVDPASLTATVDGVAVAAPTIVDGVLTWVGDLVVGQTVEIGYAMSVAADGSSGSAIANSAAALAAAADPLPDPAACAAAAAAPAYNCVTVSTPIAAGPSLAGATQPVAPGKSTAFDVFGKLATAGDSGELTVALLDPKTGEPVAGTSLTVAGGTWSLDPATGIVTFTASADFDGNTPPLSIRVTDGNGFVTSAELVVTHAKDPGTGGNDGGNTGGNTGGSAGGTKPGLSDTGGAGPMLGVGIGALLLVAGVAVTLRRLSASQRHRGRGSV